MRPRYFVRLICASTLAIALGCNTLAPRTPRTANTNWPGLGAALLGDALGNPTPKIMPETFVAAARLHEQRGMIDKAIVQYRKAIGADPEFTAAHHRLGVLLSGTGRHDEAAESLQRAVTLDPDNAILHNDLGFELAMQRRLHEAERELRRAVALEPNFARAQVNLGMVLAKLNRPVEALTTFIAVLPEADAYYNLGLLLSKQHRYQDAAAAYRHVLAVSPDFSAATIQLEAIGPKLELTTPLEPVAPIAEFAQALANATANSEAHLVSQVDPGQPVEPSAAPAEAEGPPVAASTAGETEQDEDAVPRWGADANELAAPDQNETPQAAPAVVADPVIADAPTTDEAYENALDDDCDEWGIKYDGVELVSMAPVNPDAWWVGLEPIASTPDPKIIASWPEDDPPAFGADIDGLIVGVGAGEDDFLDADDNTAARMISRDYDRVDRAIRLVLDVLAELETEILCHELSDPIKTDDEQVSKAGPS